MPTPLTDDPTQYPASITAPLGGDPRTDVSIQTPLQQLANRTANTKGRLDAVAPASANGVAVVRHVTGDAALLGIGAADRVDRSLCLVDGLGVYQFLADSPLSVVWPWVRQPNDIPQGSPSAPGRWVLYPMGVMGVSFGIPQLDATGRLPPSVVRNGVVGAGSGLAAPSFSTPNATPTDVAGAAVALQGLLPGDVVFVDYSATLAADAVGHTTTAVATVTRPDNTRVPVSGSSQSLTRAQPAPSDVVASTLLACGLGAFAVTMSGNHVFTLQISAATGGTAYASNAGLRAWAWRP